MSTLKILSLGVLFAFVTACSSNSIDQLAGSPRQISWLSIASDGRIYMVEVSRLTLRGKTAIITKPGRNIVLQNVTVLQLPALMNDPRTIKPQGMAPFVQPIQIAGGGGAGVCAFGTGNATSFSSDGSGASFNFTVGSAGTYTVTFYSGSTAVASASWNYAAGAHAYAEYDGPISIDSARDSGPDNGGAAVLGPC